MAFIRGNLLTFAEMEAYRVYQDEGITIYEVHSLVYDDLAAYVNDHSSIRTDMVLDEETMAAIQNTYDLLTADGAFDSRIRYADR